MPTRAGSSYPDTWRIPDLSEPRYSQSLERGLAILECFTPETPVLGIADIAAQLGMSRSTTHRYVTTLLALGYLRQGARRKYRLGLLVTELGMSALNETSLREHAHADLGELAHRSGYAASIAVLEGDEILCVDWVQGFRRRERVPGPVVKAGVRLPAYCTALGKVLLANLPEYERREAMSRSDLKLYGPNTIVSKSVLRDELTQVLEEGLAVEDEELVEGRVAIAAPVFDDSGEIAAAVDLTASTPAIAVEELADALGPHLISTADRISSRLGARRESEAGRD
jgi:IclR family pca regulon transcriptional regulator